MQLFTYMDHLAGVCSPAEIGTPWQARWSPSDVELGLCADGDVGKAKPPGAVGPPDAEQPAPFVALTKPERKRLTQELSDKLLIMAHENPAAFMDSAGPQINKFLDAASRLDETPADNLPFTKEQLQAMNAADLNRYIIKRSLEMKPPLVAPPSAVVATVLLPMIPAERLKEAMAALKDLPVMTVEEQGEAVMALMGLPMMQD